MNSFIVFLLFIIHISYASHYHSRGKKLNGLKMHTIRNGSLIVGGRIVSITDYPYMVNIQITFSDGFGYCDGTILSVNFVLTAGHCLAGPTYNITIHVGASVYTGKEQYTYEKKNVYRKFVVGRPDYDIGILKVKGGMVLDGKNSKPALLAPPGIVVAANTVLTAVGWGKAGEYAVPISLYLRAVAVPVIDHKKCEKLYTGEAIITARSFCAGYVLGGKGTCNGDSGGPAVNSNGYQVGIVAGAVGCSERGYPAVFTDVASFRWWIKLVANV